MIIVRASKNREAVGRAVSQAQEEGWADAFLHLVNLRYHIAVMTEPWRDLSVMVQDTSGKPVALAIANDVGNKLGFFGEPIIFSHHPGLDEKDTSRARLLMVKALLQLMHETGLEHMDICPDPGGESAGLPEWQLMLANGGGWFVPRFYGVIDLTRPHEDIWRDVRNSYRPLVNKGRRLLRIKIMDKDNPDVALFDSIRTFHHKIAGRVTRPHKSWDEMFAQLCAGRAALVTGWLEGELVAASFIVHDDSVAIYGTGIYDRELFKIPLAHATLWTAIENMQEKGLNTFMLGEVYLPVQTPRKEHNIAHFKKGFTSRVLPIGYWRVQGKNPDL